MFAWIQRTWFRKLLFSFLLIVIPAILTAGFLLSQTLRTQWVESLSHSLLSQANLIAADLPVPLVQSSQPSRQLQSIVAKKGETCECRVTVINKEGKVLADSEVTFEEIAAVENHRHRPEFKSALAGQEGTDLRTSSTLGLELSYAAVPFRSGEKILGSVRTAIPNTDVEAALAPVRRAILLMSLIGLAVALVLAFLLSRSLSLPVATMAQAAERLSVGDYSARVDVEVPNELGVLGSGLNTLAERIQETILELNREKTQLQGILTNMNEAVAAIGERGMILAANPAFSEIVDKPAEKIKGRSFLEILRNNQLEKMIQSSLQNKVTAVEEISILNPQPKTFEAIAAPLINEGEPRGVLLVLHDITRLRQLEQIRKDFVANVSHELRTPLASIKGYAETLREGGMDDVENRDHFLKIIEKHVDNMTALVDDLLQLAAVESRESGVQVEEFSMKGLAEDVLESLRSLAKRKKVRLESQFETDEPAKGDKNQIRRLWTNLIENAIKFNVENGVVEIGATASSPKEFFVKDSGLGIPSAVQSRVFERFFRVDKARSREMGGTGLGLSIVKHIVESHGGRLRVTSREGEGSIFYFTLPDA